jgi:hypothetical protein
VIRNQHGRIVARKYDASEIALGIDDGAAWVAVKVRIKGRVQQMMFEIPLKNAMLQSIDIDPEILENDPDAADALFAKLGDAIHVVDDQYKLLAELIFDWNWADEDSGEALPKPYQNPSIFKELYTEQIRWLSEQSRKVHQLQATEGNAPSGNAS